MKYIGLLMVAEENDILADTLGWNAQWVDELYVLDGTRPSERSKRICRETRKCVAYLHDDDLPRPPYPENPVDGYRRSIHELAIHKSGADNWFLLLHGDEKWMFDPRDAVAEHPGRDGFVFDVPFFFPRAGEIWKYNRKPVTQLRWSLGPGWPEFRMFRGGPDVHYNYEQHFDTRPGGLTSVVSDHRTIEHYLYRSPMVQWERALRHQETGFDPDNYRHILDRDEYYWTDAMIDRYRQKECFRELRCR